ncbi:unnamed protein product, partial [Ixodes hexagonus]
MPVRNCLLIRDFLVPRLEENIYGTSLKWVDRQRGIFQICWIHQGSKSWNSDMGVIFKDWALIKDKWNEDDPNRMVKAKQRIRAAFAKHRLIQRIPLPSMVFRAYRIKKIKSE